MSQQSSTALHDSTNGQVMADPGNSPPASSASSPHSRQRESLLYGLFSLCYKKQVIEILQYTAAS